MKNLEGKSMEIHDLIPLLRAYPEIQKRLIDLMTDEQLEKWADILEAKEAAELEDKSSQDLEDSPT